MKNKMEKSYISKKKVVDCHSERLIMELDSAKGFLDEENEYMSKSCESFKEIVDSIRRILKRPKNEVF